MRMQAVLPALCLILALSAVVPAQSTPPQQPASIQKPSPAVRNSRLYYYVTPEATLTDAVHTVPAEDQARFDQIQSLFAAQGCSGDQLQIEPLHDKHGGPSNLVCTWPGDSPSTVVVLAEYEHEGKGQSAVENWSGAVLLPYLYFAMQARPRTNSWVFVASGSKSGSADYVRSLTGDQKKQVRAAIVLQSLGVSPILRFFSPYPESDYLPTSFAHLQMTLALATLSDRNVPRPQSTDPSRWLRIDDTQPFRYSLIPSVLLHSISGKDISLPGSARDTPAAIDGDAYYKNYQAIAVFLAGLDALASSLRTDDRIWHGERRRSQVDVNDLPRIH